MKKTAVLLAGLLLVSGTVFAEGWDVSRANMEASFNVLDSVNGMNVSNGDTDLNVKLSKELKEGVSAFIEIEADEADEATPNAIATGINVSEGDFTVQIKGELAVDPAEGSDFNAGNTDGTYVKWNVMGSENAVLGLHPWGVNTEWDNDTFEAFRFNNGANMEEEGAVTYALTVNETTSATATWVVIDAAMGENANAFKVEGSTKAGEIAIDAYFGMVAEVEGVTTDQTAMGVYATMPMGSLTLSGEFNTETIADADAKVGMFAKAALAMAEMNGYGRTAYASFKSLNDIVAANGGGASTEMEAGLELTQGSFTVTPKVVMVTDEDKVFGEDEGAIGDADSTTTVGLTIGYSL
jgi:hypothetical protein